VPAKGALFLGKLKRFEGTQWFDLPPGIDLSRFSHVVLWSRKPRWRSARAAECLGPLMPVGAE
jgi:hypothetical protein